MRIKLLLLTFTLSLIALIARAKESNVINLATYVEPPYANFVNDEYVGIHVDIINAIAAKLNISVNFIQCPFVRCLSLMKTGDADLIIGIKLTTERSQYMSYITPPFSIQHFPLRFFVQKDSEIKLDEYQDLKSLRIGTLRGVSYFEQFDNDQSLSKFEVREYQQLIQMLLKSRIDTFMEREESILPWIDQDVYQTQVKLANYQYAKAMGSYIAVSKNSSWHSKLVELKVVAQQLIDSGEMKHILSKSN